MQVNDKEVYRVSYVMFDDETGLPTGESHTTYDAAVAYATRQAAKDTDYDPFYVFKAVAKVQNTPPTLPVVTL